MALPPIPTIRDMNPSPDPANQKLFNQNANIFFPKMPGLAEDVNNVAGWIGDRAVEVEADATTASDAAGAAAGSAAAAGEDAAAALAYKNSAETAAAAAGAAAGLPSLVGKSGSALRVTADELGVEWGAALSYDEFLTSGTYTIPPGATELLVYAVGAGASGVRRQNGAGGVPGEGILKRFRVADLTPTVAVTIGAGGEWNPANTESSVEGGDTSFGAYLTAFGGRGRVATATGVSYFGKRTGIDLASNSGVIGLLMQAVGMNVTQGLALGSAKAPDCIYGAGAGGGALATPLNAGGKSVWAGAGGDGADNTGAGQDGNFPGGGGGSTASSSLNPGNGADGVLRIWAQ